MVVSACSRVHFFCRLRRSMVTGLSSMVRAFGGLNFECSADVIDQDRPDLVIDVHSTSCIRHDTSMIPASLRRYILQDPPCLRCCSLHIRGAGARTLDRRRLHLLGSTRRAPRAKAALTPAPISVVCVTYILVYGQHGNGERFKFFLVYTRRTFISNTHHLCSSFVSRHARRPCTDRNKLPITPSFPLVR